MTLPIRIELFGSPAVHRGETTITDFRTRNGIVLLALLVLNRDHPLPREILAEALWPDAPPERQRSRLRYELSLLRTLLGGTSVLRRTGNHAVTLSEGLTSDVWDFEQACLAADRAGSRERGKHLQRAAHIPATDLLPGYYEESIVAARDRLRVAHYSVLTRLVEDDIRQGNVKKAAKWRALLAIRYSEMEHDAFDAISAPPPLPQTPVISRVVHLEQVSPSFPTYHPEFSDSPATVRVPSTPFFGRTEELKTVRQWLESRSSALLTITGPAGVGKTRLAHKALPEAVFVPLANLYDSDRLHEAIHFALPLAPSPKNGETLEAVVVRQLRSQPTVLILDNVEQLVDAGAQQIATLVADAPETQIVITSRSRLEVAGERELPLSPLLPEEGCALFLERARSIRADFFCDENVAAICRLLDDLPLALELAAARTLTLTSSQILDQLSDRFAFLVSSRRDIPERRRSLRAAIEWSIHLLSPPLMESFFRLCTFEGGFSDEAAAAVCVSKHAIVNTLESLRAHSLLQVSFSRGAARYEMLLSLREFGRSRAPFSVLEEARLCHARFFQALAARLASEPSELSQMEDGAKEHREDENFRTALEVLADKDPQACATMSLSLARYWERIGRTAISRSWLERSLLLVPENDNRRGLLLERLGAVQMNLASRAQTYARSIAAFRAAGDRAGVARICHAAASTNLVQGNVAEAREQFADCLALRREIIAAGGVDEGLASTMHMLAVSTYRLNSRADVAPLLDEAENLLRSSGTPLGLAFVLNTRRSHAWNQSDILGTRCWGEEVEAIFLRHNRPAWAAHTRAWLALPALAEGDLERAASCIAEARALIANHDDPPNQSFLWAYHGLVSLRRGDYEEAFTSLCQARELLAGIGNRTSELNILRLLGNWHVIARGDARRAIRVWSAVDNLQADSFVRLPAPERRWQEEYEALSDSLLGSDASVAETERAVGTSISYHAVVSLAIRR